METGTLPTARINASGVSDLPVVKRVAVSRETCRRGLGLEMEPL